MIGNCESEEEGTRNVVAECLGKLALFDRSKYNPRLRDQLKSDSPFQRATIASAIKFAISAETTEDENLKNLIESFIPLINDSDLVRILLLFFSSFFFLFSSSFLIFLSNDILF